jgi:hypothetical protein
VEVLDQAVEVENWREEVVVESVQGNDYFPQETRSLEPVAHEALPRALFE